MKEESKTCPHCKKENQGFIVKGNVGGSVERSFDENGNLYETNLDRMYWKTESSTVRCGNCNKIIRSLVFDGKSIVEK